MIRVIVCGYLALSLVVGPIACCCAFGQALVSAAEHKSAAEPPACCCSKHCDSNAAPAPASKRPPGECPCRQSSSCCRIVAPGLATSSLSAQWLSLVSIAAIATALELLADTAAGSPIAEPAHHPFLDCADLLDVQHKLRC